MVVNSRCCVRECVIYNYCNQHIVYLLFVNLFKKFLCSLLGCCHPYPTARTSPDPPRPRVHRQKRSQEVNPNDIHESLLHSYNALNTLVMCLFYVSTHRSIYQCKLLKEMCHCKYNHFKTNCKTFFYGLYGHPILHNHVRIVQLFVLQYYIPINRNSTLCF